MSNFSVNQPQVVNEVEVPQESVVQTPKIQFENLPTYKEVVANLTEELQGLINEGDMTPQVAERVSNDFMYTAFTQIVKVRLLL